MTKPSGTRRRAHTQIVWFKRDLRVSDHAPLVRAAEAGPVLPIYIAEPEWWAQPTHSARQWSFIRECLEELDRELATLGAGLTVETGDATETLARMLARFGRFTLWSHEETGDAWSFARDRRVAAWTSANGVEWRELPPAGVVRRLKTRDGWASRWEQRMAAPPLDPPMLESAGSARSSLLPTARDLGLAPDPCAERQVGGRSNALVVLDSFLSTRGRNYRREMSTPVHGFDACSRLSPHLAWGAISTRECVHAASARLGALRTGEPAQTKSWAASVRSFQARLHWRCHFMQKLEDEPAIETQCMHSAYEGLREPDHNQARLDAWSTGQTGIPFVDACMRALIATGWMNFRMRSMLTAVASYHLWLDWRKSGPVLARLFTDFEPGIHWSQMQMQSGVTGINTTRVYNPVKQSNDQDPEGAFIRKWLPELACVQTTFIHTPWLQPATAQRAAGCVIGRDYPEPIVDHLVAARAAKTRVHSVRAGDAFHAEKRAVMRKHASRKPGRDRPAKRNVSSDVRQLSLDF